jgi:hypothetical protein
MEKMLLISFESFSMKPLCILLSNYHFPLSAEVCIEYLLPYSPDLNPIEEAFSKIKHWIRHHQDYYLETEGAGVIYDMLETLEIITPYDAEGYFYHTGYF